MTAPDPLQAASAGTTATWRPFTSRRNDVDLVVDHTGISLWRPAARAWPWQPEQPAADGRAHVTYPWDHIGQLALPHSRGGWWGRQLVLIPTAMETAIDARDGLAGTIARLGRRLPVPAGAEVIYIDRFDVPADQIIDAIVAHSHGRFPDPTRHQHTIR